MSGLLEQLPVLLVVVPLLAATALAAVGLWLPRVVSDAMAVAVSAACAVAACWLTVSVGGGRIVRWLGDWRPTDSRSVGIALVGDRLAAGLTVVAAVLVCLALVYSWRYIDEVSSTYQVLMLVFLASMTGFAMAGDLFNAFVWFELMGAAAYALAGMRVEERRSVQAALEFGVVNTIGASFSLVGVSLLYAVTGELNLAYVGEDLRSNPSDPLVILSCALLFTGVLVKAAAVPFHFWTADAEAVAPSPVCAIMSGAMVATGVYAVARWWWVVFDGVVPTPTMRGVVLGVGAVTALLGAVMCVCQRHVKRLLAYSTISHVGVSLLGVGLLDEHGLDAAAAYLAGHAATKGALFLATGTLLDRYATVDEHALFGRARDMPITTTVFVVGGLGLAGCPALGVWLGKSTLEHSLTLDHRSWLIAVVVLAGVLTGGAVLRVAARVFGGWGADPRDRAEPTATEEPERAAPRRLGDALMLVPASLLLAAGVVVAVLPRIHEAISTGAAAFVDREGYVSAVTEPARPVVEAVGAPGPVWTASSLVLAVVATLAALGVAAASLWGPRVPALRDRGSALARRPVQVLHALHEGDLGNYVAWLVVGAAVLGVTLSL